LEVVEHFPDFGILEAGLDVGESVFVDIFEEFVEYII